MKRIVLTTILTLSILNFDIQAQSSKFRQKIEKEISTYPRAFTQQVIFEVSRYFRMRGEIINTMQLQFRGIKITRKQLSANTCIYEFIKKHQKLILAENEVRKLAGLSPASPVLLARKPTD
ncbi:hypothetical protein BKI52_09470 [marine bacterium AO1-C]|nr:hypothetical protein BKI52_09470 [marine bacterium AO1-C]